MFKKRRNGKIPSALFAAENHFPLKPISKLHIFRATYYLRTYITAAHKFQKAQRTYTFKTAVLSATFTKLPLSFHLIRFPICTLIRSLAALCKRQRAGSNAKITTPHLSNLNKPLCSNGCTFGRSLAQCV